GGDADAAVADPDHGFVALPLHDQGNLAARPGVLGGVVQQVHQDLLEASRVGVDVDRLRGEGDHQPVILRLDERAHRVDGVVHRPGQLHRLLAELDPTAGDPADVEQVVDHASQVV